MDLMAESVPRLPLRHIEVIIQIVHVHLPVAETAPRRDVEVTNHLVHAEAALDAAALAALRVQQVAVVFALALLDALAAAEGPADRGVGFADFFAGVAAAGFDGRGGRGGTEAVAAVVWGEMGGWVVAVEIQRRDVKGLAAFF